MITGVSWSHFFDQRLDRFDLLSGQISAWQTFPSTLILKPEPVGVEVGARRGCLGPALRLGRPLPRHQLHLQVTTLPYMVQIWSLNIQNLNERNPRSPPSGCTLQH